MSTNTENNRSPWGAIVGLAFVAFSLLQACSGPSPTTIPPTATPPPPCSTANGATVEICIFSSDTKQDWLNAVVQSFNAAQIKTTAGKTIVVSATHGNSGTSKDDILKGKLKPTIWSPGDQSWVKLINPEWTWRTGKPLISTACQATVYAPVGFAMWRPMAEALGWPDKPISWDTIAALAADPQGWATYGNPQWGQFKFGHTHPAHSNSGLLLTMALAYSVNDRTSGLTPEMVKSAAFVDALTSVEQHTYHYGTSSKSLLNLMVKRGPEYLHATNTSEADTLKYNRDHAGEMRFPLAFIFPAEGTFWAEQPFCLLDNADWVSAEQKEAARLFEDYLHQRDKQELALTYNLRPVDSTIPVTFTLDMGTNPRVTLQTVPNLESPAPEVSQAVIDVFYQTKKKATVILVLDTSGSMGGDKIKNATEAAANFIGRLEPDDEIVVIPFSSGVNELQPSGLAREVGEGLSQQVRGLRADGGTALYDAVCRAVQRSTELQAAHEAAGEKRLYGIVVLTDGLNQGGATTQEQMFNTCLPTGEDVEGVKVFTIAYGNDADKDLLKQIAERTNGKTFSGDPETIEQVYLAISAEQ
jgi:Ca-activated chloride channel family protein